MKTLATKRPFKVERDGLTQAQAEDILRKIAVAIMDHGSVRLEGGTMESAAIIHLMSKG